MEGLFLINFFVYALTLGLGMILNHQLFKSLKKRHAGYYKSIGEPIVVIRFKLTDTENDVVRKYIQGLKGGVFGYSMVFRGTSKDFPQDISLRKLAQAIRITLAVTLVLFITLVITGYFFYKSTPVALA